MRLNHQLRTVEKAEAAADGTPGSVPLPKEFIPQFRMYSESLGKLMEENRRYLALKHGSKAAELPTGDEAEEIINAVELLTDDELRVALSRRTVKDGGDR